MGQDFANIDLSLNNVWLLYCADDMVLITFAKIWIIYFQEEEKNKEKTTGIHPRHRLTYC